LVQFAKQAQIEKWCFICFDVFRTISKREELNMNNKIGKIKEILQFLQKLLGELKTDGQSGEHCKEHTKDILSEANKIAKHLDSHELHSLYEVIEKFKNKARGSAPVTSELEEILTDMIAIFSFVETDEEKLQSLIDEVRILYSL